LQDYLIGNIELLLLVFGKFPQVSNFLTQNKIAKLRNKSQAAIDAAHAITDAKVSNPLNLDQLTTNA
jgi:hypothetical protein